MNDVVQEKAPRLTSALLEKLGELFAMVLRFERPADRSLSDYFRAHPQLGHAERGVLAESIYAGLRHKRLIETILEEAGSFGAQVRDSSPVYARAFAIVALLRLRNMNVRELAPLLRASEVEWLNHVKGAARGELPLAIECDLPDWVLARLLPLYDEAPLRQLARALQQPAPLDLRVNTLRAERDAVIAQLAERGIEAEPTPYSPHGLRIKGKPALQRDPLFLSGAIEVQDEGSQLLTQLLAPKRGEMVADFCAGAGGKTLAIAALMRSTGRVYAFDVSEKRLAKLKPRMARSGASNVDIRHIASERDPRLGRLSGKLDRVLVDSPCTGLGTLRRNPDLKWRQTEQGLEELGIKQAAILRAAAKLLKPGGRLVYATCSMLREENEAIVEAFLADHPQFKLLNAAQILAAQRIDVPAIDGADMLRLLPHVHGTDVFFAAVMEYRPDLAK
jgi:16S rRNA (cytosine967-C5)-methyltransferase